MAEVLSASVDVDAVRARFSSLRQGFAFFDAPGGTQVPDEVGDAMALALREASANLGAGYATSIRVGKILEEAEAKAARFLGCEPREVIFGANMTTLNFALSRTAARAFSAGDEILVSCLDHDAGVRDSAKLSVVMLAPKITSRGSQPRNRAALTSASSRIFPTRMLVA